MGIKSLLPERFKDLVGRPLGIRGVAPRDQWQRHVMNETIDGWIEAVGSAGLSAVEVGGDQRAHHPWRSFSTLDLPDFDLCAPSVEIPESFDVVVCEQVLEHVRDPWLAMKRLFELTKPGGHTIVSTPFMIRVHAGPGDYWRFTEDALRLLAEGAGFQLVSSGSWGNRRCVRANLRRWAKRRPWSTMRNDRRFPVAVWVIGERPGSAILQ